MVPPLPPKSGTEIDGSCLTTAEFHPGAHVYENKSTSCGTESEEKKEDDYEDRAADSIVTNADYAPRDNSSSIRVANNSAASAETASVIPQVVRRSGRKRTNTTITVQGHTIKKINNYVVKGITYEHGTFQEDKPKIASRKKAKNDDKKPSSPRKVSLHVKQRQSHNDVVRARVMRDKAKRLDFMTKHYDAIEPFIEDKIKSLLQSNMTKADSTPNDIILGTQPDIVSTTLRDYQMIGLDWMVKMHESGMPLILGDEMGLGKTLQTISLIAYLKESKKYAGPSL
ncbi:hypothetical protein ACHAXS_000916, partial [Conticribra weissflogii]